MGWLGSVFNTVFNAAKQFIGPGFEFTPSGIVKEIGHLTSIVADAVPIAGPFISHAVGAVTSAFSKSPSPPQNPSDPAVLQKLDAILISVDEVKKSLSDSTNLITKHIDDILEKITDQIFQTRLKDVKHILNECIEYFDLKAIDIDKMHHNSSHIQFGNYIRMDKNQQIPELISHFINLKSLANQLKVDLGDSSKSTGYRYSQHYLELYMLVVSWTLTYGKAVLHLYAYCSNAQLGIHNYTGYLDARNFWSEQLAELIALVDTSSAFLLGRVVVSEDGKVEGSPGYLEKLRNDRLESITAEVEEKDNEGKGLNKWRFDDNWHPTAFGYAGLGEQKETMLDYKVDDSGKMKLMRNAYVTANMAYFDRAIQFAIVAAESWRKSAMDWKSRVPLQPYKPNKDDSKAFISGVTKKDAAEVNNNPGVIGEDQKEQHQDARDKNYGYPDQYVVQYGVAYVTYLGEGILSDVTAPMEVKDIEKQYFLVKVAPVSLPPNVYTKYASDHKISSESEALGSTTKTSQINPLNQIRQRVYVQYINNAGGDGKVRYNLVGEVGASGGEIWDFGAHAK